MTYCRATVLAVIAGLIIFVNSWIDPALAVQTDAAMPKIKTLPNPTIETVVTQERGYSPKQLEKIKNLAGDVVVLRDRLAGFQPLIEKRQWSEVHQAIPDLLSELRQKMSAVTDQLELQDRLLVRAIETEVLIHLEKIDEADEVSDAREAEVNYQQALQDFDAFLQLVPEA